MGCRLNRPRSGTGRDRLGRSIFLKPGRASFAPKNDVRSNVSFSGGDPKADRQESTQIWPLRPDLGDTRS